MEKKKPLSRTQVVHGLWFPLSPRQLIWKGHGGKSGQTLCGQDGPGASFLEPYLGCSWKVGGSQCSELCRGRCISGLYEHLIDCFDCTIKISPKVKCFQNRAGHCYFPLSSHQLNFSLKQRTK